MAGSDPQRSCLGCRTVKDKADLLRFVLDPDRVLVPDLAGKLPGRGAYTCIDETCLRAALGKRQFARSFRGEVKVGVAEDIVSQICHLSMERIASALSLANKAGKAVSGTDTVMELLKKGSPGLVVIATDISVDSAAKILFLAEKWKVPTISILDKERLGSILGKELRSVVAIERGGFSEMIQKEMNRFRSFFKGGVQSR